MPWLFLLFVVLPAFELYLLIQLGQLIGGLNTFFVIVATGLLGSYMAKTQGLAAWRALNTKLSSGQMPGKELMDGAIILVAGTLLITPGVLTDVVGFLGLIPVSRSFLRTAVSKLFKTGMPLTGQMRFYSASGSSVDRETNEESTPQANWSGQARQKPSYDE